MSKLYKTLLAAVIAVGSVGIIAGTTPVRADTATPNASTCKHKHHKHHGHHKGTGAAVAPKAT